MTSPIRSGGAVITNLFTIPQKQEGREGNRWEGRRMASKGHNAYCSLPPHPLHLRPPPLLCSARFLAVLGVRERERAEAHNQSDNTVYKWLRTMEANHKEFWEHSHRPLLFRVAPACQTHRYTSAGLD